MFTVGQKVVKVRYNEYVDFGTVARITTKKKEVVVNFGNYERRFNPDGLEKNPSEYQPAKIIPMTPEIQKEIDNDRKVEECKAMFEKWSDYLTTDQCERIMKILEE